MGEESIDVQKDIKEKRKEIELNAQQKNVFQNSIAKLEGSVEFSAKIWRITDIYEMKHM